MIAVDLQSFTDAFGGGKDQVAFNLLRGFQENGNAGEIIVYCRPELKSKVEKLCPNALAKCLPDIISFNKKMKFAPIRKIVTVMVFFLNCRKLLIFYKQEIKNNDIKSLIFTDKQIMLLSKLPCKTFFITHDIQFLTQNVNIGFKYKLMTNAQTKCAFRCTDEVICISEYDLSECKSLFKTKMVKIYDPIVFSDNYFEKNGSEYITAINIQHHHKNPVTLIRAFALIKDELPYNVKLLFIGNNDLFYQELCNESEKLNVRNRVIFSGYVSEDEKCSLLKDTRLFVNPSSFEGFGMAAVELMAMGIPCIVADNTAQKETTMGLCRYYSPATDEHALADAILNEFNNPKKDSVRKSNAEKIRDAYDYRKIAGEYWNLLNKL